MQTVITLVSIKPEFFTEDNFNEIRIIIENNGGSNCSNVLVLKENHAVDILFDNGDKAEIYNQVRAKFAEKYLLDIFVQKNQNRKKKLLLSDMDSTLVAEETLAMGVSDPNKKNKLKKIVETSMRGEINFIESVTSQVEILEGMDLSDIENVVKDVTILKGAEETVKTMLDNGTHCVLVSGGFDMFTHYLKEKLGFHETFENKLEIEDGKLTGNLILPICDEHMKLEVLNKKVKELGLTSDDVLAVGDGSNDVHMIMAAGSGVAINAKQFTRDAAEFNIYYNDLTALLFLQGYKLD